MENIVAPYAEKRRQSGRIGRSCRKTEQARVNQGNLRRLRIGETSLPPPLGRREGPGWREITEVGRFCGAPLSLRTSQNLPTRAFPHAAERTAHKTFRFRLFLATSLLNRGRRGSRRRDSADPARQAGFPKRSAKGSSARGLANISSCLTESLPFARERTAMPGPTRKPPSPQASGAQRTTATNAAPPSRECYHGGMDDFERRWRLIHEQLLDQASGAQPRAVASQRTLFGIRSSVEEKMDRFAARSKRSSGRSGMRWGARTAMPRPTAPSAPARRRSSRSAS